jgi:deoxyribodipyrimidine photolyase-like uncharacterized protein
MSSLADLDPERDTVLMVEVHEEAVYVRHHKQKIALVLSAMRHFAEELLREGVRVEYVRLDDLANTGSCGGELKRAGRQLKPSRVVVTEPGVSAARGGGARGGGLTANAGFASRSAYPTPLAVVSKEVVLGQA